MVCHSSIQVFLCFLLLSYLLQHVLCEKCPSSFNCGNLGVIDFPFTTSDHPDCGLLVIHGCDDNYPDAKKSIKSNENWFDVSDINLGPGPFTVTIRDDDLHDLLLLRRCKVFNYVLPFTNSAFASFYMRYNVTLFKCNHSLSSVIPSQSSFSNYSSCPSEDIYYQNSVTDNGDESFSIFKSCSALQLPITNATDALKLHLSDIGDPFDFASGDIWVGIKISHDCSNCYYVEGGQCRVDSKGRFYCAKGMLYFV